MDTVENHLEVTWMQLWLSLESLKAPKPQISLSIWFVTIDIPADRDGNLSQVEM